jgi:hypothetical protein
VSDNYKCSGCGKKLGSGAGSEAGRKCVRCGYIYCAHCCNASTGFLASGNGECPRCGNKAVKLDHV